MCDAVSAEAGSLPGATPRLETPPCRRWRELQPRLPPPSPAPLLSAKTSYAKKMSILKLFTFYVSLSLQFKNVLFLKKSD